VLGSASNLTLRTGTVNAVQQLANRDGKVARKRECTTANPEGEGREQHRDHDKELKFWLSKQVDTQFNNFEIVALSGP
jgi:hypothetical protein